MPTIRILPDHLASQIAAGEVVERPASVVKELVENALDARATALEIDLEAGGRRRVGVADDGIGMDRADALLAFDRHATSKIATFDDLERVASLGFRGEALASIASVSRTELVTATAESVEGTRVLVDSGKILAVEPIARPRGSTVTVSSLFANVPARRKFLRSAETELRRSLEIVQAYALARPDVRFALRHDGQSVLDLPPVVTPRLDSKESVKGSGNATALRDRIGQVFGPKLAEDLSPVPGGGEWLGWIGGPVAVRGRPPMVLVNGRVIRDRAVSAAFRRAVREAWRSDDLPQLFLQLTLDPHDVDVNVHPQKSEVRFRDPRLIGRLEEGLRLALGAARGVEPVWARPLDPGTAPPAFAWSGLGGSSGSEVRDQGFSEVGGGAGKLAEATYASLAARPEVALLPASARSPLTGRFGETRSLRYLGQYKGSLLLFESADALYVIDQHVAHERILYERLRRGLETRTLQVQRLLEPRLLGVSTLEGRRLSGSMDALESHGFLIRELSAGAVALAGHPDVLSTEVAERLLVAFAATEDEGGGEPDAMRRRILEALAADQACKAAIKMHHALSPSGAEALIEELFRCAEPYACPHGRPVILSLPDRDLERWFGRR